MAYIINNSLGRIRSSFILPRPAISTPTLAIATSTFSIAVAIFSTTPTGYIRKRQVIRSMRTCKTNYCQTFQNNPAFTLCYIVTDLKHFG